MSKHQINYSRVVPDHRVPFDYAFVKKLDGPLDYFKVILLIYKIFIRNGKLDLIHHG